MGTSGAPPRAREQCTTVQCLSLFIHTCSKTQGYFQQERQGWPDGHHMLGFQQGQPLNDAQARAEGSRTDVAEWERCLETLLRASELSRPGPKCVSATSMCTLGETATPDPAFLF